MTKHAVIFWTVMVLAAAGLVDSLMRNWLSLLIPIVLIALVYILYKYPPGRVRKAPKIKPSAKTEAKMAEARRRASSSPTGNKRKNYPFQVIDGQKGKQDDDYPKFH
jgi:hypothetical protein